MRLFVTGATGFIGQALVQRLLREGHTLQLWVRSADRAAALFGSSVAYLNLDCAGETLQQALAVSDGVVNLAGAPIIGGRWDARRKQQLVASRVQLTERLVAALRANAHRPSVLISGSAVGYYGDRGAEELSETSSGGDDFLARLCQRWEAAAEVAGELDVRVVLLRTGVVLGAGGGALAKMLLPFRLGLGGKIGSGRQFLPWIHIDDAVGVIAAALQNPAYRGPINLTAPAPVTNAAFAKRLGAALSRPALLPVPASALRLLFGEAASVLLASQRALPRRLEQLGYTFAYPNIDQALAQSLA